MGHLILFDNSNGNYARTTLQANSGFRFHLSLDSEGHTRLQ